MVEDNASHLGGATDLASPGAADQLHAAWDELSVRLALLGTSLFLAVTANCRRSGEVTAACGLVAWVGGLILAAIILLIVVPTVVLVYLLIGFWFLLMQPAVPFVVVPMLFLASMLALLAPQMDMVTRTRKWLARRSSPWWRSASSPPEA